MICSITLRASLSLKDAQKRAKRVLCQNTCILGIAECSRGRQRRPYLQYGESPIPAAQLWRSLLGRNTRLTELWPLWMPTASALHLGYAHASMVASKICKLFVPAIAWFLNTATQGKSRNHARMVMTLPLLLAYLRKSLDQSCLRLASRDCLQAHDLAVAGCTLVQSNF